MSANYYQALELFENGHYREAVSVLENELAQHPENYEAWLLLADAYHELHEQTSLLDALENAFRLKPERWEAYVIAAEAEGGFPDKAALRSYPSFPSTAQNKKVLNDLLIHLSQLTHNVLMPPRTWRFYLRGVCAYASVIFNEGQKELARRLLHWALNFNDSLGLGQTGSLLTAMGCFALLE